MEVLVRNLINEAEECLKKAGIADWKQDSFLLAEHVFHITRSDYFLNPQMKVEQEQAGEYKRCIDLRCKRIPLQHITGIQEFMGLKFHVNNNVLIPRQDTEILVEEVLRYIGEKNRPVAVLDICTGSGCIAISIDKLAENARVSASDISERALETARENNRKNQTNVTLMHSDLFEKIDGIYDVIVSNPPYIRTSDIDDLMDEVRLYDPRIALDGEDDGMKFYREISRTAPKHLKQNGAIFYEIGNMQAESVTCILAENGFENIQVIKDLTGNDRVVFAKKGM